MITRYLIGLIALALTVQAATEPTPLLRYTFDAPFGYEEPKAIGPDYPTRIHRSSIKQSPPARNPGLFGNAVRSAVRQNVKSVRSDWAKMIGYDSNETWMIATADLRDYFGNRKTPNLSQNDYRLRPAALSAYRSVALVRPVSSNVEFTVKVEDTPFAKSVIAFESEAEVWKFAVLLMPMKKGEPLPLGLKLPQLQETLRQMSQVIGSESRANR